MNGNSRAQVRQQRRSGRNTRTPRQLINLTPAHIDETPEERFRRLAIARTNNALEAIRLVGNLTNRRRYEWTDEQAETILKALQQGYGVLVTQFHDHKPSQIVIKEL